MFSALKRIVNKTDNNITVNGVQNGNSNGTETATPPGVQKLDKTLQRKFAHGINYNIKVVIKGDTRVGKSSLFKRLEGQNFDENYTPTEQLTVTSINWNHKASDDVVKIDLWEVVDAQWRKSSDVHVNLKTDNGENAPPTSENKSDDSFQKPSPKLTNISLAGNKNMNGNKNPIPDDVMQSLALLSENFDVYKGTHVVLLVMDMTKLWTFKYVQAELPKIPRHIPVLVVANHRDQGHHRTVSREQVESFIDELGRSPCDGIVMYAEASMKNGFGLKLIEKFFNIPFSKLQEASLLKQLELNRYDFMSTMDELKYLQKSIDVEYEQHLQMKTALRRQEADAMSPVNNLGLRQVDETVREKIRNTTVSSSDPARDDANLKSIESSHQPNSRPTIAQTLASQNFVNDRVSSIVIGAKCPLPETKAISIDKITTIPGATAKVSTKGETNNDGKNQTHIISDDSDDDETEEPRANPLVANYQSDLDSDDQN